MNTLLKLFFISFISLLIISCNESEIATMDTIKGKALDKINSVIGKGDVAIQKYKNKIESTREALVKLKVSRKMFEDQLSNKIKQLDNEKQLVAKNNQSISERITLLDNIVTEMTAFLKELNNAETRVENALKQMIDNLETIKLKLDILSTKKTMIKAIQTAEQLSSFQEPIVIIDNDVNSAIEEIKKQIYQIDAEIEVTRTIERQTLKLKSN